MSTAKKPANKNLDDVQAALQSLIAQGRKEGMIRASELNAQLEKMDLSPEKIERFQKLRTRLKDARELVELANECGRQVCDEARHFACPFGDESMENCALRLEAKYDETIGLLLDLAERMG